MVIMRQAPVYFVAAGVMALSLGACGEKYDQSASSNDCILSSLSNTPNTGAVEEKRSACGRKFAKDRAINLEVGKSEVGDTKFTISNNSDVIVTKFAVNAGQVGSWSFRNWIEPGDWVDIDAPGDSAKFMELVSKGGVKAESERVIEVQEPKND